MEWKKKNLYWLILIVMGYSKLQQEQVEASAPKVPCYFIFGDSLVDNGNNNNLSTFAKANFLPYGIDFPGGPSGRFCNGRTIPDFFAQYLGFENFIPSFATAKGEEVLQGVNYGSGSAGIRDETGTKLGTNICFNKQLANHKVTISRIVRMLKDEKSASQHLNKCLYSVVIGSNDYLNNYFKPDDFNTFKTLTPKQYATALIQQYSQQLSTLYNLGARKVAVSGLGPIGCIPDAIANHDTKGKMCVEEWNDAVKIFNHKLKQMVHELNAKFKDAKFIILDNYRQFTQRVTSLGSYFKITECCDVEKEVGQCIPNKTPCNIRSLYMFFDSFHPTEATNFEYASKQIVAVSKLLRISPVPIPRLQ